MNEGMAPPVTTDGRVELPAFAVGAPVLLSQRAALQAFRAAERTRAVATAAAVAAYDIAVSRAHQAAANRSSAAARALDEVRSAGLSVVEAAAQREQAACVEEIPAALKQADEARDRAVQALERVRLRWLLELDSVELSAGRNAAAGLRDAVGRTTAALQPLLEAVRVLEESRRGWRSLLRVAVIVATTALVGWWGVRAASHLGSTAHRSGTQTVTPILSPDEERAAVQEVRRVVHETDRSAPQMQESSSASSGGSIGYSVLFDGNAIRRIIVRRFHRVTETYYFANDVIFRYEHVPNPAEPTDGFRYYFRAGLPVRVRRDTTNLVVGTAEYAAMNPDSLRAVALRELSDARSGRLGL